MSDIITERGKIYGDPTENHKGIASMWAPMLQPWANDIARGKPLPPHVVTLMMTLVKINRMRRVYHEDNFTDAHEYLNFAQDMQAKHVETVERPVSVNLNARDYE